MDEQESGLDREQLRAQINSETARIEWAALERHFASGVVIRVADHVDLVDIAVAMVLDERDDIERALAAGDIALASSDDARRWLAQELWAVVAAPWVLVQERAGGQATPPLQ